MGGRRFLFLSMAGALPLYAFAQTREPNPAARRAQQPGGGTAPMPGYAPTGDQISQERLPLYHRGTPTIALCGPKFTVCPPTLPSDLPIAWMTSPIVAPWAASRAWSITTS